MESPSSVKLLLKRLSKGNKVSKLLRTLQEKAKNGFQMLELIEKVLRPQSTPCTTTDERPGHEKVFGRDEERYDIISKLHEVSSHSVIGIYGISKSGTTTLAQYVCKYEKEQAYFSHVIWIDVSQSFDMDGIYREMFDAASMEKCPDFHNPGALRDFLDTKLRDKRFLLVLDGMQEAAKDKRCELVNRLKTGMEGSKIIVTTWSKDVAMSLGDMSPIKIRELSEKDLLDLFMHYALGDGHKLDNQRLQKLQEIGEDIAKQMGRSPWATREVAEHLRMHMDSYLDGSRSISQLLVDSKETIRGGLLPSYRQLDQPIRRCFAYCSLFPRKYLFKPHTLIQLWMAEGFIEKESTGTGYLRELVSRSFMQTGGKPGDVWYTIPETMHELAEEAAGTHFLRVQGDEEEMVDTSRRSLVRHLFISSRNAMKSKSDIYKMKKLRTLIISADDLGITVGVFERMLKVLTKLRVVQVYLDTDKLMMPESVCGLKHLRFLGFLGTKLRKVQLPKKFGKLYNLQTIECSSCHLDISKVSKWHNLINLHHMPHITKRDDNWSPEESTHSKVD